MGETPAATNAGTENFHNLGGMEEILNKLATNVPDVFKEQARVTAGYISRLDLNNNLKASDPGIKRFAGQLSRTGFIVKTHFVVNSRRNPRLPLEGLPNWLRRPMRDADFYEKQRVVEAANKVKFEEWMQSEKLRSNYDGRFGRHFYLDESKSSVPPTRQFKIYIEGENLSVALDSNRLPFIFSDLAKTKLKPKQMKFFEGFLVVYFHKDVRYSDYIREVFDKRGVVFRGPAQDVYDMRFNGKDELELNFRTSNDAALGTGVDNPVEYKLKRYNAADFFDNYLRLCLWGGKDPSEPYKTSFVYFVDKDSKAGKTPQELIIQASQLAQYPVVYTTRRYPSDLVAETFSL